MKQPYPDANRGARATLLARLASDRAGNTMAIIAAAIAPMLAMVGGGIDMGRSYLAQARLQQACDAGVLAARKKLGSAAAAGGLIPAAVGETGNRFFDINFQDGSYGTANREFTMRLQDDYSITGEATVDVPTTIMRMFGNTNVPLRAECEARLNFSNTDIMMVLDTTGSMNDTNPGDSESKIVALRAVVKNFHTQLEAGKGPGIRLRYGFVPYSTNVNVGYLLQSGWLVDQWTYQGREAFDTGKTETYPVYDSSSAYVSGSQSSVASFVAASCPASTTTWKTISSSTDPDGTQHGTTEVDGYSYWCTPADNGKVTVTGTHYNAYRYDSTWKKTGEATRAIYSWTYKPMLVDVSGLKGGSSTAPMKGGFVSLPIGGSPSLTPAMLRGTFRGCIEERSTYEISDYSNVDLARARDLDIDSVPDPGDPETQWRPMLHEYSFIRAIATNGSGTFSKDPVTSTGDYLQAAANNLSTCPSAARKLAPMTSAEVARYVDGLKVGGQTYHDIGMIWGGRLLSSSGIFAEDNADVSGKPTNRHLIFLTDGETAPLDLSYGTYGIEPLDQRRWSPTSPLTLTQVVENRFSVACNEVKKRNITVWVVGFGTTMTDLMKQCAGEGHWFQADDAAQLSDVFNKIAKAMGELRISR